ncbi:tRNA (adenine(22)-N(1))-methyltransferase [Lentibacillus salicampi]|uniref:tRNA (Adenine-N(1))-methyltransferase n=1 Tax=Lentibacillus salicampi TaxID=175306 RepID=A0A4Y9AF97_9BACI|nr:class I SAM-dependent methyltransferase [Lentibacillus salicampi]TFJ94095.1 tRNA (adenine-N(1))-methyltransferase [Lentibacillus salicampi]
MSNHLRLSKRLEKVASFITQGVQFADIGSDHAHLPCYVCLHDEDAYAIAGEVNEGPFRSARENISRHGLSDRVDVRLGDGLQVLQNGEVALIVIAGMGGSLIKTILDEGKDRLSNVEKIIAQPNIGEHNVRRWLYSHGYEVTNEVMVAENGHIYEIIVGDKRADGQKLTEKQLLFGPHLLNQKPKLFYQKWTHEYDNRKRTVEQMKNAKSPDDKKIAAFTEELTWIGEVLGNDNDCS